MRLISAHIRGYGRIVDSKINLDAKVIAIVGPNEAGKTTLLKALSHVDGNGAVPHSQRSRATEVTDETQTTTFHYVLDNADRDALADLDLGQQPTRATISRTAAGDDLRITLSPLPTKSLQPLQDAMKDIEESLKMVDLDDWIDPNTIYADPNSDAPRDYRQELQQVAEAVNEALSVPGTDLEQVIETAQNIHDVTLAEDRGAKSLKTALISVIEWEARENPEVVAGQRIWRRSPDLIMFSEDDRSLQSAYTFSQPLVENPPAALSNLAGTASLDLKELFQFVSSGDVARRRTALTRANRRMDHIFSKAWKQSHLSVHFELDGDQLRLELIEDEENVTVFDERSSGLRMFVALISFLRVHGSSRPPILLIDEAENHLHIDAQADLVNMFVTQEQAVKVIYTTHSPACLPPDLGTGIRVVNPKTRLSQVSEIRNSFWQGSAGYSPLMLAMGAAAAAYTPARFVVLAEGATEMILLPTLIRAAIESLELPYQVAPGLSEARNDFLPDLDLQAARVAYLIDGDHGGDQLLKALVKAGVPENLVVQLDAPGVEHVIDANQYSAAISSLLPECNPDAQITDLPPTPDGSNLIDWITTWAESNNLRIPSKVAVANWLVENGRAVPSGEGLEKLKIVHEKISAALKLQNL